MPIFYVIIATIVLYFLKKFLIYKYNNKKTKLIENLDINDDKDKIQKINNKYSISDNWFKKWLATSIVVGLFLLYPSLIKNIFSILSCTPIGDKSYLTSDMSIQCYTNQHNTHRIFGLITLLCYGLGIPFIAFKMLYKYRYMLYHKDASSLSFPDDMSVIVEHYPDKCIAFEGEEKNIKVTNKIDFELVQILLNNEK